MTGPHPILVSASFNNSGSFLFTAAFNGTYDFDFMVFDTNSQPPYTVRLSYSIDGGQVVVQNVTIPAYRDGISDAFRLHVNQTLSGNYAILTQARNPVDVNLEAQICLAGQILGFVLTNNGNARANVEVQILMDGKPAGSLQLQPTWVDVSTTPEFQSTPATYWCYVPAGGMVNENVSVGLDNCWSHQFSASVLQQLKA